MQSTPGTSSALLGLQEQSGAATDVTSNSVRWCAVVVSLLAFGIRVIVARSNPLFPDELFEAREVIGRPILDNLVHFRPDAHLLHALLTMPMALVGWEPLLLRWVSLLAGVVAVPLVYQLGKRLFNPTVGLLSAAMLSVLTAAVRDSTWIRGYSLMITLSLLSTIMLFSALSNGSLRYWLLFGIGAGLLIYVHAFGILFAVPTLAYAFWQLRFGDNRDQTTIRRERVRGVLVALAIIVAAALSTAALMSQSDLRDEAALQFSRNWDSDFTEIQLSSPHTAFLSWLKPLTRLNLFEGKDLPWPYLAYFAFLVLAGVATGIGRHKHRPAIVYLLMLAVVPMLLITLAQSAVHFHALARYLDFSIPSYVLLASCGAWAIARTLGGKRRAAVSCIGILAIGAAMTPGYAQLSDRLSANELPQWPLVARYLKDNASADDLILCVPRDDRRLPGQGKVSTASDACLLHLHFYPDLADRVFEWDGIDFIEWQNLLMPGQRCISRYYHLPSTGIGMTCQEGRMLGPRVWAVFWQPLPTDIPFVGDSSAVKIQYNDTRLVAVDSSDQLGENLKAVGELITSDDAVTDNRARQNLTEMANLHAALAETAEAETVLQKAYGLLESLDTPRQESFRASADAFGSLLPYLGGTPQPEVVASATWGGQITLAGYTVRSASAADDSVVVTVTAFWKKQRQPDDNYVFFYRWQDIDGQGLYHQDYHIYDDRYPLADLPPGHIVRETRALRLPMPRSAGRCALVVGVYDPKTEARLPLEGDSSGQNVVEIWEWNAR